MMKRTALTLFSLFFLVLATPAQALKLIVWDGDLQTKLGAGESSGGKFNVQLVKDFSGPVKVMFSQSSDEKAKGTFSGLLSSYDGILKNGQLTLLVPDADERANDRTPKAAGQGGSQSTTPNQNVPAPVSAAPASSGLNTPSTVTLGKFLQQFKLSVSVQPTSQINNLFNIVSKLP